MRSMWIILGLFLILVSGGCVQGPEEETGTDFRRGTMEWPSARTAPQETPGPRQTLEQR